MKAMGKKSKESVEGYKLTTKLNKLLKRLKIALKIKSSVGGLG